MGSPKDLSKREGDIKGAVLYSFVKAMAPGNKESAYLHLPTYTAGIIYHIGTFLTLLLFIVFMVMTIFGIEIPFNLSFLTHFTLIIAGILFFTSLSGLLILAKRVVNKELRSLSGPDDYLSNIITTLTQLVTAFFMIFSTAKVVYFVIMTLFFLWLPVGKTKHLMYFFFARYHLGFFYGWRGTWPQKSPDRDYGENRHK